MNWKQTKTSSFYQVFSEELFLLELIESTFASLNWKSVEQNLYIHLCIYYIYVYAYAKFLAM